MGKLDGKVALITGSATGIGRATALLFASEGAKIVIADYAVADGKVTEGMIKEMGKEALFLETDVRKPADVQRTVDASVAKFGRIDVMFANAGIMGRWLFGGDALVDEFNDIIDTNLKGVFYCARYILPVMVAQGGGVIVNTASTAGILGLPGQSSYGASKAGVIMITKTMALEYADKNIRINCICPGGITTRMSDPDPHGTAPVFRQPQPMRRFGKPEEVARLVLWLSSEDASYINGAAISIDGGWTSGFAKVPPKKPKPQA